MTVATPSALAIHLQLAIWYINKKTLVNPKTTSSGRQPCQMLLRSLRWLRLRKGELGGRRSDPPANNCCLQCFFGSWILWISPWRQSQKPIHPLAPCQPNWNLVTQRAHQTLQRQSLGAGIRPTLSHSSRRPPRSAWIIHSSLKHGDLQAGYSKIDNIIGIHIQYIGSPCVRSKSSSIMAVLN